MPGKLDCSGFRPDPKPEKVVKDKKPYRIPKLSKKREAQNKEYLALREVFLVGKICPVTGEKANQIHHRKGRIGKLLTDVRYFLGVSDRGHKKIEANPEWAYKMGYSLLRNAK